MAKKKTQHPQQIQEENLDNFNELIDLVYNNQELDRIKQNFSNHLKKILDKHATISQTYLILFLYDDRSRISEFMADRIYNAIPEDNTKPILLIIHNNGGRIEPAYLISKTCIEKSPKFVIAIPRRAKSAATLISLGGNEIHMGSMSELGPIDPQFGDLPALGLSSSLESIAKVVSKYEKSSEMFAEYLSKKLDLRILGYFERVSESAKQYAQRLLQGKEIAKTSEEVAHAFVYEYKDHGFVIDKEEAKKYLGEVIKENTNEYKLANEVHQFMDMLNLVTSTMKKKSISIIGTYEDLMTQDIKPDDN